VRGGVVGRRFLHPAGRAVPVPRALLRCVPVPATSHAIGGAGAQWGRGTTARQGFESHARCEFFFTLGPSVLIGL
jgi:hypothetical protein